ncbi:right-handed parallel beta-helix repeat-containing protein, partial [Candidatus Pacearchaeota archaeon]|nr:right-handed parallel beta-helix repeat-containing protein [Candidatus Pacearchaeota archaeon]
AGFGSGHIIYGNEVSGGAEGIASGAAEGLTCVNNYIHNGSGYGLNLQNSTTTPHTVLNNIIDSQGQGMYLVNIDNAMISKNIVTSSTGTGAYLISGATGNTLTGNFISNSSSTGIRFSSDSTGNTLGGVSATDGNVIISNTTDVYDEDSNSGDNNTCNVVNNWRDTGLASDGCTTRTIVTCGDGFIDGAEDCDDGGTSAGDGCSATCTIETGYGCLGEPSSCQLDSGFTTSAGIANAAPSFNSTPSEEWDATTYGPLWSSVSNTSTNHLYEVIFIGAEGWVVGDNGELMYSDDSGTSWTQQTSSTSNGLYAIDCVDTSNCWAV